MAMYHAMPPRDAVQVPVYNVFGSPHHGTPYKDRTHLKHEEIRHHKWLEPEPKIRSRSELQQSRKCNRVPGPSYDFDGDGVVGQLDYFVGRSFDKNCDGRLSKSERAQADNALQNGFLDKYVKGLDSTGDVGRDFNLLQKRGAIFSKDNQTAAAASSYGAHHNAHKAPPHPTVTSLELSRKAELKGYGAAVGERWARACAPVKEPYPHDSQSHPRTCAIAHIRERAEADHQLARVNAGLLPVNAPSNPEREYRTVGLGYVEAPHMATRSQLNETRKEIMKRDAEVLREKGEEHFAPLSVRRAERDVREYDFRRPGEYEPKTLSTLKDERKQNRIEYDMANFSYPDVMPREYPRYSDREDIPFWINNNDGRPRSGATSSRSKAALNAIPRSHSEPVLKVNQVPWAQETRELASDNGPSARSTAAGVQNLQGAPKMEYGCKTKKRFTSEYIEHGQGRNKPRLFDNIQPVRVGPRDLEHLDLTSSMAPIRDKALLKMAEDRKKSVLNPRCSKLFTEHHSQSFTEAPEASRGSAETKSSPAAQTRRGSTAMMDASPNTFGPRSYGGQATGGATREGVRCGGFQKLDWIPPHNAPQVNSSSRTRGKNVGSP